MANCPPYASRFQRWFLYWGNDDCLWHYSGDDGKFAVWGPGADGVWVSRDVIANKEMADGFDYEDSLIRQMPVGVFENLPKDLRQRWGLYKNENGEGKVTIGRKE